MTPELEPEMYERGFEEGYAVGFQDCAYEDQVWQEKFFTVLYERMILNDKEAVDKMLREKIYEVIGKIV